MRSRRSAFTLVEMLVVITIIGVLAALVMAVGGRVLRSTRNAAMQAEISLINQAVAQWATDHGGVAPPDFAGKTPHNKCRPALLKAFPGAGLANPQAWAPFLSCHMATNKAPNQRLDPAEALVFWLGGYSNRMPNGNPANPGIPKKLLGFVPSAKSPFIEGVNNPAQMYQAIANRTMWQAKTYFPFDEARLVDQDNDGWYEYLPKYSSAPYVYFTSGSYENELVFYQSAENGSIAVPYRQDSSAESFKPHSNSSFPALAVEPDGHQLICAGQDGVYGSDLMEAVNLTRGYPYGALRSLSKADLDNLTNFAPGLLGDQNPDQ
jgi:prepilin-type N-terminal cleavage/methylation domain-containing protein